MALDTMLHLEIISVNSRLGIVSKISAQRYQMFKSPSCFSCRCTKTLTFIVHFFSDPNSCPTRFNSKYGGCETGLLCSFHLGIHLAQSHVSLLPLYLGSLRYKNSTITELRSYALSIIMAVPTIAFRVIPPIQETNKVLAEGRSQAPNHLAPNHESTTAAICTLPQT